MNPAIEHHNRAMDLADKADSLRRTGQVSESIKIYRDALVEEQSALAIAQDGRAGVKTLSVLYRSAASLALDCKDWTVASNLIKEGLKLQGPGSVEKELKELQAKLQGEIEFLQEPIISGSKVESNIQADVELKGSLRTAGDLFLDGILEGEIIVRAELTVGEKAEVQGPISARSLKLRGKVRGNVAVQETCVIFSNAALVGDLEAARLIFEEGASFIGQAKIVPKGVLIQTARSSSESAEPLAAGGSRVPSFAGRG